MLTVRDLLFALAVLATLTGYLIFVCCVTHLLHRSTETETQLFPDLDLDGRQRREHS